MQTIHKTMIAFIKLAGELSDDERYEGFYTDLLLGSEFNNLHEFYCIFEEKYLEFKNQVNKNGIDYIVLCQLFCIMTNLYNSQGLIR